jgi:hypothetical protein
MKSLKAVMIYADTVSRNDGLLSSCLSTYPMARAYGRLLTDIDMLCIQY